MTDDLTDEQAAQATEDSEKEDNAEAPGLAEYRRSLLAAHDHLDEIKESAKEIGAELENRMAVLDSEDDREECQKLIHMSVMAYQRVDRGDHQLLRGL